MLCQFYSYQKIYFNIFYLISNFDCYPILFIKLFMEQEFQDLDVYKNSKNSKTGLRIKKDTKQNIKKTKSKEIQSQESNVMIDIGNQNQRFQHKRPSFIQRWDGSSQKIQITQQEYSDIAPMMKIYWEIKSKNMNSIIFVQMGKFDYYAYEIDALKLHQLFQFKLRKFSKFLMVYLNKSKLDIIKIDLFKMKVPLQIMTEIDDQKYRNQNNLIKRQVTEIITPAINLSEQITGEKQRFLLSLYKFQGKYGAVIVDCEINKFFLQQIQCDQLRAILNKFKPVEIVYLQGNINQQKKMFKQVCNPFINQIQLNKNDALDILNDFKQLNECPVFLSLEEICKKLQKQKKNNPFYSLIMALNNILEYFKKINVQKKIFSNAIFEFNSFSKLTVREVYDAQIYENLQLFELKDQENSYGQKGTLFAYLNKCSTQSGERKLRNWINSPLTKIQQIKERQEAIIQIIQNQIIIKLSQKLKSFPDFQKKIAAVYHWILDKKDIKISNLKKSKQYNQNNNVALSKVKEIRDLLLEMIRFQRLIIEQNNQTNFKSSYLKQIFTINQKNDQQPTQISYFGKQKKINRNFPKISKYCNEILSKMHYQQQQKTIEPVQGFLKQFDEQKKIIDRIKFLLKEELQKWKEILNCEKIYFVSAKARNQMEMPKGTVKSKPKDLLFSSTTSKFDRYTTTQIQSLTQGLKQEQTLLDQSTLPFLRQIIKSFSHYKSYWNKLSNIFSEIDVLISLAKAAKEMDIRCLPNFGQVFQYEQGIHIGLMQFNKNIVRNSVKFKNQQRILLITGPNMGGKSTLLRQTCLLAIIAQIGSFVPARSFKTKIFDKFFCRIGATDKLIQKKSTFMVELEETKSIIQKATKNSLVIIDQLGRGTSTFDGISIAYGTLKYLIQIRCFTLFSTHYAILADEFTFCEFIRNQTVQYKIKGNRLQFAYKLVNGVAQKSFAQNVARMVNIQQKILMRARQKQDMITKQTLILKEMQQTTKKFTDIMMKLKFLQQ